MRDIIVYLVALVCSVFVANAQGFQGVAVYESKTSLNDMKLDREGITPEMKKMIQERMKKAFEKTFVLNFDKTAAIYKEEETLGAPGSENDMFKMMSSFMGSGGNHYKNVKDRMVVIEKEFFGKEFLITDTLPKINWKLGSETKKIGEYTCYKATAEMPTKKSDFRNLRPKKEGEEDNEEERKKEEETQKTTNFMDQVEMPDYITVTAWYAPEIPVSQGPEEYWGLPGLILEVSDGKTILLCSKVVLNPQDKKEIKAPSKGKKVTQQEYDEIVVKKVKEMQEMYAPRGGGNGQIRFGG